MIHLNFTIGFPSFGKRKPIFGKGNRYMVEIWHVRGFIRSWECWGNMGCQGLKEGFYKVMGMLGKYGMSGVKRGFL